MPDTVQYLLVVANRTCPCPGLVDEVHQRVGSNAGSVLILAPALNSRLRHYTSDTDRAVAEAEERLAEAVGLFSEREIPCEGQVGDSDPAQAVTDALTHFPAQEILISTHPPGQSNWLERGLVEKIQGAHDVPVRHVVSRYGLEAVV